MLANTIATDVHHSRQLALVLLISTWNVGEFSDRHGAKQFGVTKSSLI
jgi:hypothetical protein